MITLKIPEFYRPFVDWKTEVELEGGTAGEVLEDLFRKHPAVRQLFFTHWGILSANVLIYLNGEDIFSLQGLDTPVGASDRLRIVPTVSGG